MSHRTWVLGCVSIVLLLPAGSVQRANAGECIVEVLHEDPPKCIHAVQQSGPPCAEFVKRLCNNIGCGVGWEFCPGYPTPWGQTQCAPGTLPGSYPVWVSYKNYCPAFGDCCDSYPPSYATAHLDIFGGEIVGKESCRYVDGSYVDCEAFECGAILCPGKHAIFTPWPTSASAANALFFDWNYQYWDVTEAPLCGAAPGGWAPNEPGHPYAVRNIEAGNSNLVLSGPGRYRVRTHAALGYSSCIDPESWCEVTLTDWGGMWSNSSSGHTTICIGRKAKLSLWMEPWWLDRGTATLEISGETGAVRVSPEGSLTTISEPVEWSPPHCRVDITGDPEADTIDPLSAGDDWGPSPVVFDVTGLQEGQVTFTLSFAGTGASCDPLIFTANVECCCDVCEEEPNAQWIDYAFTGIGNCPPENCPSTESDPLEDDCGNRIVLTCGHEGDCNYQYFFNSTVVGRCVYGCGRNSFQVKYNPGRCRIVATRHRVRDSLPGDEEYEEGCDEGTGGVYDWQVYIYNACTGTGGGCCREGPVLGWEEGGESSHCESAWWGTILECP